MACWRWPAATAPRLTEQIKGLRRSIAAEMGFVLPPVRIQDNMQLGADSYSIRVKEIEAGRGELRPTMLLAMDPKGGTPDLPGEQTREPAFGLPALWIDPALQGRGDVPRLHRGRSAQRADHASHRGGAREHGGAAVLRRDAEAARRAAARATEAGRRPDPLADHASAACSACCRRLLAERVSIRDLPTILEGIQEACGGAARAIPAIVAHVRARLARQISDSHTGAGGYIPLVTLSAGLGGRPSPRRWPAGRRTASSPWRRASCRTSCSGCAACSTLPRLPERRRCC